ncbi:hypothetical protein P378_13160 [Desulforamulus profundi]|uniref:Uncharacterized protein n=1 Tax=Desulforamulus profundi TaxID=1383067 RepID=A0A2C6LHN4_9FIRM|nr:hypothetical protein P378_13160 [Desulforamulus profundi]
MTLTRKPEKGVTAGTLKELGRGGIDSAKISYRGAQKRLW